MRVRIERRPPRRRVVLGSVLALVVGIASLACEPGNRSTRGAEGEAEEESSVPTGSDPKVEQFFREYAVHINVLDLQKTLPFYGPYFIVASPSGSHVVANDHTRPASVEREIVYMKGLGMSSGRILSLTQTSMNGHHVLVRIRWGVTFTKTGDRTIELPFSYLFDAQSKRPQILAVVVELDEPALFRDLALPGA